jgi:hypothetical protein
MPISRRKLGLMSASFLCSACLKAAENSDGMPSCVPSFDATNGTPSLTIDYRTISPMGSMNTDPDAENDYENSLIVELFAMAEFLGLNFAFGYYQESTIPNAAFVEDAPLKPLHPEMPSDGTILIGRKLLCETKQLAQNFGPAITALCAHESGHALQKKYMLRSKFKPSDDDPYAQVRYELCADFVCGYYAAFRKDRDSSYPAQIQAITQFRKGDKKFEPSGHGTSDQRADAVTKGYLFAKKRPADGKAAVGEGVNYSLALSF